MQRQILIIDDHDDLATSLYEVFSVVGHRVKILERRDEAVDAANLDEYDLVITDLDVKSIGAEVNYDGTDQECLPDLTNIHIGEHVKAFKKIGRASWRERV